MISQLFFPANVYLGKSAYSFDELRSEENAVILHGNSAESNGALQRTLAALHCKEPVQINVSELHEPSEILREIENRSLSNFDLLIGIGGGSVIDKAKFVMANLRSSGKTLKLATFVTLPGSGAEASKACILNSSGEKKIYAAKEFLPDIVSYDEKSMRSLPRETLTIGCIDSLVHSVESTFSVLSNPLSSSLANSAIDIFLEIFESLEEQNPSTVFKKKVIDNVCVLSFLGGLAQSEAGSGITHALAHTLEPDTSASHSELIATCFYPILQIYLDAISPPSFKERLIRIDKALAKLEGREHFHSLRAELHSLTTSDVGLYDRIKQDPCWRLSRARISEENLRYLLAHRRPS
ncbi:iron-containing alcohol dehydrogenase [Gammaproteobacteria bacterium]|nr:iron-containing alcohol dehydrogenase [Gammaproteobacteria bacterium]